MLVDNFVDKIIHKGHTGGLQGVGKLIQRLRRR